MARSKGGCGFVPRAYVELVPDATKEPEHELVSVAPVLPPPLPALPPQQPPPLPPVPPPVASTPEEAAPTPPSPAHPSLPPPPPRATLQQTLQTLESMLPPPPPPPPPLQQPLQQPLLATAAPAAKPASTISHFNVVLGKKKKGRRVTLGISNQELIIDEHDDTAAPRKFATGDIAKCTAKKTVVTVTIDGTEFDFLCASAAETERVADAIGAARRGMFIGDRVLGGGSRNDESLLPPPPPPPPKDNSIALMSPPPPPRPAPQEYAVVLYSFSSNDAEELDVDEGARVLVLDRSDVEWWKVQLAPPHGRTGLVPASYLELQAGGSGDGDSRRSIAVDSTPPLPTRTDTLRSAMARTGNEPAALNAAVAGRTRGASLRAETPLASAFDKSPDSDNIPLHSLQQRQAATATAAAAATATLAGPEAHKMRKWTD
ncbi:cytoskeletal protein binding protein, partial [Coemansia spiralis]